MTFRKGTGKIDGDMPLPLEQLLKSVTVPSSSRTKEEAWAMLVQKLQASSHKVEKAKTITLVWKSIAVAASVALMLTLAYLKFSTQVISTSRGEQIAVQLPDGSEVQLNACSEILFNRYWILNHRTVTLSGEAFFKVKKGKLFTVSLSLGHKIEVLGTQFNVLARDSMVKVSCYEGKIRLVGRSGKSITLLRGNASVVRNDSLILQTLDKQHQAPTWIAGEFYFEAVPVKDVIDELMRQFKVNIITQGFDPAQRFYTGYFSNKNLNQALEWVTVPMSLQYSFINDTTVSIYPIP